jgi:hypothetical protein
MMQVEVENAFNNIYPTTIFKELCDAKGLWQTLSPLPCYFMMFIFFFTTNMGGMWRGSPLLSHFQAQGKGDPLRGPLFSPLLNFLKDHHAGP